MSHTFTDREKAFETGHQLDEEIHFKAIAKRDRAFGLWAAAALGLDDEAAHVYADRLVDLDLGNKGEAQLLALVLDDLTAKGIDMTEGRLRIKLDRFMADAEDHLRHQASTTP